jgi:hypothetical protein
MSRLRRHDAQLRRTRRPVVEYYSAWTVLFVAEAVFAFIVRVYWLTAVGILGAAFSLLVLLTAMRTGGESFKDVLILVRPRKRHKDQH